MATMRGLACVGALALGICAACGGSTSGSSSTSADAGTTGTTSSSITSYQELAGNTRSAANSYRANTTGPQATSASCRDVHDQYDAQVRPWVSRMVQMGRDLDDFMGGHGGSAYADMRCASATMMDELDHHRSVACTLTSLAANQAEAARHADAMNSYAGHAWDRCGQMLGSFNGSGSWGPMMAGCENWSGTCCSSMMWGCCGGMMGGRGMMNGDNCCGADGDWHER